MIPGNADREDRDDDVEQAHPGRAPAEPLGDAAADSGDDAVTAGTIKRHRVSVSFGLPLAAQLSLVDTANLVDG